jgi:hypothetical protein
VGREGKGTCLQGSLYMSLKLYQISETFFDSLNTWWNKCSFYTVNTLLTEVKVTVTKGANTNKWYHVYHKQSNKAHTYWGCVVWQLTFVCQSAVLLHTLSITNHTELLNFQIISQPSSLLFSYHLCLCQLHFH